MTFDVSSCSDKSEFFFIVDLYIAIDGLFRHCKFVLDGDYKEMKQKTGEGKPMKSFGLVLPINDIDHHISAEEQNNFCAQLDFVKLKRLKKKKIL